LALEVDAAILLQLDGLGSLVDEAADPGASVMLPSGEGVVFPGHETIVQVCCGMESLCAGEREAGGRGSVAVTDATPEGRVPAYGFLGEGHEHHENCWSEGSGAVSGDPAGPSGAAAKGGL
jgi:hypothetical protein